MAKKAALLPLSGPVTPAEVVGWFVDAGIKKRPLPKKQDVIDLAEELNQSIKIKQLREDSSIISKQHLRMFAGISLAAPYLAKAQPFLKEAVFFSDDFTGNIHNALSGLHYSPVQDLIAAKDAIESLLKHMPPKSRGRKKERWPLWAGIYAYKIQKVLLNSGWVNADISGDDSAIPFVVSKLIFRVRGMDVKPNTIARRLRA